MKPHRCSICGGTGHHTQTCHGPPRCAHCQVEGTLTWRFGGKPLHPWCVSDFLHGNAVANPALKVVHV